MRLRLATAAAMFGATLAAASGAWAFDARSPDDVLGVLRTNGASGEMMKEDDGKPFISAKAGALSFDVHFYRCNDAKTSCQVVIYQLGFDSELANIGQINRWNAWTFLCPAYLTPENHPHVWFGAVAAASDTRETVAAQQNEWLACLTDFDKFTDDPEGFLKAHQ